MIKIGVVGIGGMGTVHISNYAYMDDCKVTAVVDRVEQTKLKYQEAGIMTYDTVEEMLSDQELDIVDICTPTFLHKEQTLTALNAGVNVICEKPAALSSAGAKEMCAAARDNHVQLFIAQVVQYGLETMILRDLVSSNTYGKVLDAQFIRLSAAPRWIENGWLFDKEKSGLLPFDLHIHDLDLIVSLFGSPRKVSFTSCGRESVPYQEQYRFLYGYDHFNIAAEAAWYHADIPFTAAWRVYFENAVVVNNTNGLIAYEYDHEPKIFDTSEKLLIPTGINVPPTGMYYRELSDFVDKVRQGGSGCAREDDIISVLSILESIG